MNAPTAEEEKYPIDPTTINQNKNEKNSEEKNYPIVPTTINQNKNEKNSEIDTNKIIFEMKKEYIIQENQRLKEKIDDIRHENIISAIQNLKITQPPNININNNNNNNQTQQMIIGNVNVKVNSKLDIPGIYLCLFILFNLFLPGIGTIVAGIIYGKTAPCGDRTGKVICKGIIQFLTFWIIIGWIWAIIDAINSFEGGCGE
jgi:hypothetical protein